MFRTIRLLLSSLSTLRQEQGHLHANMEEEVGGINYGVHDACFKGADQQCMPPNTG